MNTDQPTTHPEPFDIDEVFRRLRTTLADLPKAAMFDLRDRGYNTPFEQLVGSLISARTRDETTMVVSMRLFEVARTPEAMAALDEATIARLLDGASFPEPKARDLRELARRIVVDHGGVVPATMAGLTAFRGVGPKIAALTLAVGFDQAAVAVDIHVHRIVNRWGYVADQHPRGDDGRAGAKAPPGILDRDQRALRAVRQVRLRRRQPEVLDLHTPVDVRPGGGHIEPVASGLKGG